jgi:hypothetical protein
MKKFAIAATAVLCFGALATDFASIDVDHVEGRKGAQDSTAQTVRIGKGFGDYQLGFQSRTAKFADNTTAQSVEATVANNKIGAFGITPFVGVGHDLTGYSYGLVGAQAGAKVGPGFALAGIKTRVGSTEAVNTKQTVAYATYSIPVAKGVAVNLNASRSGQTIKENAVGAGLSFNF